MQIAISRKELAERFIFVLFKHPSIEEICDGEIMIVPVDRYEDLCYDIGVILAEIIKDISVPFEESDEE